MEQCVISIFIRSCGYKIDFHSSVREISCACINNVNDSKVSVFLCLLTFLNSSGLMPFGTSFYNTLQFQIKVVEVIVVIVIIYSFSINYP